MPKFVVLFTLYLWVAMPASAQGIDFETGSWSQILAKARATDKIIFMDAYTTWCGPCKWLAANVFTDSTVGAFMNRHFINAKFDMEKGEGLALAKKFNVRAYPTLLFINSDGTLVHRLCGAMPVGDFLAKAQQVVDGDNLLGTMQAEYAVHKDNPVFLSNYLVALADACAGNDTLAQSFLRALSPVRYYAPEVVQVMTAYPQVVSDTLFHFLVDHYATFEGRYGEDAADLVNKIAFYRLAKPLYQGEPGEYEKARAAMEALSLPVLRESLLRMDLRFYEKNKKWQDYVETATLLVDEFDQDNANRLNDFAWTIFENASDKALLSRALGWAKQAAALAPEEYAILDTYAALLLKTGHIEAGKAMAAKAIAIAKANGTDYSGTSALLKQYTK